MKVFIISFFASFFCLNLFAQSQNAKKAIISGFEPKSVGKKIFIQVHDKSLYDEVIFKDSTEVNSGKFRFEFIISHPVYVVLYGTGLSYYSQNNWYYTGGILIEPGDSIVIKGHVDNSDYENSGFENIIFAGTGVEKIWCIQSILKNMRMYQTTRGLFDEGDISFLNSVNALKRADSIRLLTNKTITVFSPKLSQIAIRIIRVQYLPILCPDIAIILNRGDRNNSSEKGNKNSPQYNTKTASNVKGYLDRLNDFTLFDLNDKNVVYADKISEIVKDRYALIYSMKSGTNYNAIRFRFNKDFFEFLVKALSKYPINDRVLGRYLDYSIRYSSFDKDLQSCVEEYLGHGDLLSSFHKGLAAKYKEYKNALARGLPAFPFELPDSTGKIYRLADYKGKVLLMDFMFHPCKGCAEVRPFLEQIETQFKENSQIEFISITGDKNREWQHFNHNTYCFVPGTRFLNTGGQGFEHPILKYYQIYDFPTLVLIDQNGKIIANRAPDPRMDGGAELVKLIKQTLNK